MLRLLEIIRVGDRSRSQARLYKLAGTLRLRRAQGASARRRARDRRNIAAAQPRRAGNGPISRHRPKARARQGGAPGRYAVAPPGCSRPCGVRERGAAAPRGRDRAAFARGATQAHSACLGNNILDSVARFRGSFGGWVTRLSSRGHPYSVWMPPVPRIPDAYLDCVIYLYASESDAKKGERTGGSGFLVGVPTIDLPRNFWFLYAITNKHVIERGNTTIRMKTIEGGIDILETIEPDWILHPSGDDVAVCLISFDPKSYKFNFVRRSDFLTNDIIGSLGIGPGDEAFLVGRFISHEGRQQNLPTVRFGCIAQMPWEPIKQDNGFDQESFLVEIRSIGGYSGSPVFVFIPGFSTRTDMPGWYPKDIREMTTKYAKGEKFGGFMSHGPWLLGVDWGHILDRESVRDKSGRPVNPADPLLMHVRVNTGMMGAVPAWKLAELLDEGVVAENRRVIMESARQEMEKNPSTATFD
jgi:hypothetical protein